MSLIERIKNYMKLKDNSVYLKELYDTFPDQKETTIRGRINESVGSKVIRVGRGQYMLISDEVEAIVEQTDSRIAIPNILASLIYYDTVFLDIPYFSGGQKGGNRNLSNYNLIYPEEFQMMILNIQKMLRSEDSQIYFMMAGGKSSKKDALKYIKAFDETQLQLAGQGTYTKLTSKGTVCNMGKYQMPPEDIFVYSFNGKLLKPNETQLDFALPRPPLPRSGGYPTQKPFEMLKQIIKQSTNIRDIVLDLFGGSGATLDAALNQKRRCHIFDVADEAINRMVSILDKYQVKAKKYIEQVNKTCQYYTEEQK